MHEHRPLQARFDHMGHQQIQPGVPVLILEGGIQLCPGQVLQLGRRGPVGIDPQLPLKQGAVAEPLRPKVGQRQSHQRLNLIHQLRGGKAWAIPFQHGELGVVARTPLPVAKHLAQLVDGATAGGEQPFHGVFRRGLQIEPLLRCSRRWPVECFDAIDEGVTHGRMGEQLGIHFQHPPFGKEMPQLRQQGRTLAQVFQARRGAPELIIHHGRGSCARVGASRGSTPKGRRPGGGSGAADVFAGAGIDLQYLTLLDEQGHTDHGAGAQGGRF